MHVHVHLASLYAVCEQVDGKRQLLMAGTGASPEGNKPFLDLLDVDSQQTTRLWQSSPPFLESVGSIMSDNNDVRGARDAGGRLMHARRVGFPGIPAHTLPT
jgi:hypothetical protein